MFRRLIETSLVVVLISGFLMLGGLCFYFERAANLFGYDARFRSPIHFVAIDTDSHLARVARQ